MLEVYFNFSRAIGTTALDIQELIVYINQLDKQIG
jgi:hypothetical protein